MKKKLLVITTALVIATSLFGCGNTTNSSNVADTPEMSIPSDGDVFVGKTFTGVIKCSNPSCPEHGRIDGDRASYGEMRFYKDSNGAKHCYYENAFAEEGYSYTDSEIYLNGAINGKYEIKNGKVEISMLYRDCYHEYDDGCVAYFFYTEN